MTAQRRPVHAARGLRRAGAVAAVLVLALVGASAWSQGPQASRPAASAAAKAVVRGEEGVRWKELSAPQREVLAPLEREWPAIDASRKQKWIALAQRFPSLGADERGRITTRMSEWARLTPAERGQARLRFEEARQLPAPDRNARWQAYQALPADARQQLAARAASAAAPAASGTAADAARRDATARNGRAGRDVKESKVNVVPSAAPAQPPKQVAPTLVQAGPGATTTLITRRPMPPAHQQTGMPKIAATPEFVNRSTLLPRRGPQAAAVTPVPTNAPAGVTVSPPLLVPVPSPVARPASSAASSPAP